MSGWAVFASIGDQALDEFNDSLLSRRSGIELAAHLGKPAFHLRPKVAEVLPQSIEAGHCGLTEVANFVAEFRHVAVRSAGQHTRGSRILLTCAYPLGKLVHLGFQRSDARLKALRLHVPKPNCPSPTFLGAR